MVALAFLSRKPLCVESNFIQQIERRSGNELNVVYACQLKEHVPFDSKLAEFLIPKLQKRLSRIENFLFDIQDSAISRRIPSQLSFVWHDKEENLLYQQGKEVHFSTDMIFSDSWIEKIIVKHWVRSRMGALFPIDSTATEESLSDLVLAIYFDDSKKISWMQSESAKWPLVLRTAEQYCNDSWVMLEHMSSCQMMKSQSLFLKSPLTKVFVPMSVRPLLTRSLIEGWKGLSSSEKYDLLRSLEINKTSVSSNDVDLKDGFEKRRHDGASLLSFLERSSSSGEDFDLTGAVEEVNELQRVLLYMSKQSSAWNSLRGNFEAALSRRGFSVSDGGAYLDVAFLIPGFDKSERRQDWLNYFNNLASHGGNQLMGIITEDNLWILPTQSSIPKRPLNKITARQAISLSCDLPDLNTLVAYSRQFEKLLVVNDCRKLSQLKFGKFLKNGIESFAEENRDVGFVQLHLPSLMLAWKHENVNPLPLLAQEQWKDHFFKSLGWMDPEYNSRTKIFKTRSVIEAIEAFRQTTN